MNPRHPGRILSALALACAADAAAAAAELRLEAELRGHDRWVLALAFSPDGSRLASGAGDHSLRVWQLTGRSGPGANRSDHPPAILATFESAVTALAFPPDGERLVAGNWDGQILAYDIRSGKRTGEFHGHRETINALTFDATGRYLASAGSDDQLIVWDAATADELLTLHQGNEYDVTTAAFSPDGERIATGDGENQIKVWDALTGEEIDTLIGHDEPVTCLRFDRRARIISGSWDDTVRIWERGREQLVLRGHRADVTCLEIIAAGDRIVSADEDGVVIVWDATSGRPRARANAHPHSIRALAVSRDATRLATGGKGSIRLWKIEAEPAAHTLPLHQRGVDPAPRPHRPHDPSNQSEPDPARPARAEALRSR